MRSLVPRFVVTAAVLAALAAGSASPALAAGSASPALAAGSASPGLAATPTTAADGGSCDVTGGQLTWGFKESFRSYISGTIANGSWEPIDGASYETPEFSWSGASGEFDPATGIGTIAFDGGVHFTGHSGLLDTTIAQPTLELSGGSARILLDVTGVTMDEAMSGEDVEPTTVAQVPFVDLDLGAAPLSVDTASLAGSGIPASITSEGFESFPNYEPGTAFDPLSFTIELDCSAPEASPTPTPDPTATTAPTPTDEATAIPDAREASADAPVSLSWVWWAIGAFVLALGAVGIALLVRRGRASRAATADTTDTTDDGPPAGGSA